MTQQRSSFRRRRSGGTTSPGAWSAPIGAGPVATVYSGHAEGAPVAFKVFPERFDRRTLVAVEDEQTKLARLVDTYAILPVHEIDQVSDGKHALRMELCQESLAGVVARIGALTPEAVLGLGHAVAAALAAAHAVGVVHGGVKPSNVLIRMSGQPVLADFGVALRRAFRPPAEQLLDGLAPETLRSDTLDERSDLYGLGALLHTALTGEPPLPSKLGERIGDRMLRLLKTRVPMIERDGVPRPLAELVARLLLPEPGLRPPGAAWVAEQLADLLPGASLAPVVFPVAQWPEDENQAWQPKTQPDEPFGFSGTPSSGTDSTFPPVPLPRTEPPGPAAPGPDPSVALQPSATPSRGASSAVTPVVLPSEVDFAKPVEGKGKVAGSLRVLSFAGVGAACVLAGATVVWLSLDGSSGAPAPSTSSSPSPAPPTTPDVQIVVDPPIDRGNDIVLTWRTPRPMESGVVIATEGQGTRTQLVLRATTLTVPVDPKLRYCFEVQATEGGQVYHSSRIPVRGAQCAS
ncbi:serine/threonine protein kinase [Amycolatopsis samaneae]|uniref:non-specific serine/threonine protein kinase n=2 Tax=Amycolatopsis samaneae TaxID=664691 RepID=A0ABW5GC12_9PSEU